MHNTVEERNASLCDLRPSTARTDLHKSFEEKGIEFRGERFCGAGAASHDISRRAKFGNWKPLGVEEVKVDPCTQYLPQPDFVQHVNAQPVPIEAKMAG
jgi:hypothetical protein